MTSGQEGEGDLGEASQLLQEGLALLGERTREVDELVASAEQRVQELIADAERRAQEITAEAERQRLELEREVEGLRAEAASLRSRAGASEDAEADAPPDVDAEAAPRPEPVNLDAQQSDAPRWGRPSTVAIAPQAVRSRSTRSRWLRWIPFLVVLLLLGVRSMVFGNVFGQEETSPTAQPTIRARTAVSMLAPTQAVVMNSVATLAPSAPQNLLPTAAPTPAVAAPATPRSPALLPLLQPQGETSSQGPLVAVYTHMTYAVAPGDTLNGLATRFGVTGASIIRASGLADPNLLLVGQVLTIPRQTGWLYRVQPNERLDQIAGRFGTSVDDLVAASSLASASIDTGDLIFIPSPPLETN